MILKVKENYQMLLKTSLLSLNFQDLYGKRLLRIHNLCINNSMIAVKFKVQDSRFKVQDSKLYFVQRSFIKVVKRAKKY